jgi:hypothetical protein
MKKGFIDCQIQAFDVTIFIVLFSELTLIYQNILNSSSEIYVSEAKEKE